MSPYLSIDFLYHNFLEALSRLCETGSRILSTSDKLDGRNPAQAMSYGISKFFWKSKWKRSMTSMPLKVQRALFLHPQSLCIPNYDWKLTDHIHDHQSSGSQHEYSKLLCYLYSLLPCSFCKTFIKVHTKTR